MASVSPVPPPPPVSLQKQPQTAPETRGWPLPLKLFTEQAAVPGQGWGCEPLPQPGSGHSAGGCDGPVACLELSPGVQASKTDGNDPGKRSVGRRLPNRGAPAKILMSQN